MTLQWKETLPVWWSFVWRSVLYGLVGGFVVGAVAGGVAGASGHLDKARLWGAVGGYLAGFALSTVAFRQALQRHLQRLVDLAGRAV